MCARILQRCERAIDRMPLKGAFRYKKVVTKHILSSLFIILLNYFDILYRFAPPTPVMVRAWQLFSLQIYLFKGLDHNKTITIKFHLD